LAASNIRKSRKSIPVEEDGNGVFAPFAEYCFETVVVIRMLYKKDKFYKIRGAKFIRKKQLLLNN
jgi:hypothetical protein